MQGGDWGSIVTSQLARMYPERWVFRVLKEHKPITSEAKHCSALGLHLNMASASPTSIKGLFYAVVGSIIPQVWIRTVRMKNASLRSDCRDEECVSTFRGRSRTVRMLGEV